MKPRQFFSTIAFLFFCAFLYAQPKIQIKIPDFDKDGIIELTAGKSYDLNQFAIKWPEKKAIKEVKDSIAWVAVFYLTGCTDTCQECADFFSPFYNSSGQVYGTYGQLRRFAKNISFPTPGPMIVNGITAKGESFQFTVQIVQDCGELTNVKSLLQEQSEAKTSINVNVTPNPSSGSFVFDVPLNTNITVLNTFGEVVIIANTTNVDLQNYPKGLYFAYFRLNGEQIVKKLVKQ